jgi:hypothetical protein
MAFTLTSPDFTEGANFPTAYTCDGIRDAPSLRWQNAPHGAQSYVLIFHNPDSTKMGHSRLRANQGRRGCIGREWRRLCLGAAYGQHGEANTGRGAVRGLRPPNRRVRCG